MTDASTNAGHVFIYRGDIRTLSCDAWYLPTDTRPYVNPNWHRGDEQLTQAVQGLHQQDLPPDWGTAGTRVHPLRLADPRRATPVLAAIPIQGTNDPQYHRETLRQFVQAAVIRSTGNTPSLGQTPAWTPPRWSRERSPSVFAEPASATPPTPSP